MSSANTGAVFFLGSRAHYQVLTPPSSHSYDLENGNTSTETIYQTTSTENIYNNPSTLEWPNTLNRDLKSPGNFLYNEKQSAPDMPKKQNKEFDYSDGVKRRLKKYRRQDGSSEMILNDNDDGDINPADLNELHCVKQPPKHKRRVNIAYLLSILTRRRRAAPSACPEPCTLRDSCRCDDCQGRYFECDEEEEYSYSDDEDERLNYFNYDEAEPDDDYSCPQCPPPYQQYIQDCNECMYSCRECSGEYAPAGVRKYGSRESQGEGDGADDDDDDDDEEVFITSPPAEPGADARSTELLLPSPPETPTHEQVIQMPLPQPRLSSSVDDDEEEQVMLELAAGAPLLLDHLMRTPLTCAVM